MLDTMLRAPIRDVHAMFRRGNVSPVEVLECTLAELARREPELNAFVTVLAGPAREQARAAGRVLRDGGDIPPLTGIPVSVKDIIGIRGVGRSAGSRVLAGQRAEADAASYARLRRAGAVVFGTTNLLEFAYGFVHPDHGQANNPWDTGRTAGGSSSGSAASVGAGIGYGSVVTDTGGSARLPAAFCGLVGLRPTPGSIDTAGVLPLAPTLDTVGTLARTVDDAALLWQALSTGIPPKSVPLRGIRVGVPVELLGDPLTPRVADTFAAALEVWRAAGAAVREVALPGVRGFAERAGTIMLAEAAHTHRRWFPARAADYAAGTRANLEAGSRITAPDYLHALDERARYTALVDELFGGVDLLACPTIGFTAPAREPDFADGGPDYILRTLPFAATGHPALSVPAGLTADGLPAGLHLVAARHREPLLLGCAAAYERELGGFPSPPTGIT